MSRWGVFGVAAMLVLAACATRMIDLRDVKVEAAPDANNNAAVAVDVVLLTQMGLGEQLAKLTAADWFRRRTQLLRDNPDGMQVLSWELVPGQSTAMPVGRTVLDAYVFAAYASPGDHRVRLTVEGSEARIKLQATDFVVEGLKKKEP